MPVTLLDPAGYRRMPWKNGGGTTTEIALEPLPDDAGRFLWRISVADVATDGPFSAFTGYERLIAVVDGAGMELMVDGVPVSVTNRAGAFRFSGDAVVDCRLLGGPIRDFNLMVDRAHAEGRLELVAGGETATVSEGATALIHALDGAVAVRSAQGEAIVPPGWSARLDGLAATVAPRDGACAVVAEVSLR